MSEEKTKCKGDFYDSKTYCQLCGQNRECHTVESSKECNCPKGENPKGQCCPHCYAGDMSTILCAKPNCRCHLQVDNNKNIRNKISEILVKWNMPTRQVAISEIENLFLTQKQALKKKITGTLSQIGTIDNDDDMAKVISIINNIDSNEKDS